MCVGTGGRDFGSSGVPGRGADVHCVVSSHCLRLLLFKTVKGGESNEDRCLEGSAFSARIFVTILGQGHITPTLGAYLETAHEVHVMERYDNGTGTENAGCGML